MRIHCTGIHETILSDLIEVLMRQGHKVTGSDESRRLIPPDLSAAVEENLNNGIDALVGCNPKNMSQHLDLVLIGRNIMVDNVELEAAKKRKTPVQSYPTYLYQCTQDKQRIVVMGGKDTAMICFLIINVLHHLHKKFDYVVEAPKLKPKVQLSDAPIFLVAGDLAPTSSIDSQPQGLTYQHNMLLISDVGWEASSTYPTLEAYLEQLTRLADASPKGGTLIYTEEDPHIQRIGNQNSNDVKKVSYRTHPHRKTADQLYLKTPQGEVAVDATLTPQVIAAAQQVLHNLAVTDEQFYKAIVSFNSQSFLHLCPQM